VPRIDSRRDVGAGTLGIDKSARTELYAMCLAHGATDEMQQAPAGLRCSTPPALRWRRPALELLAALRHPLRRSAGPTLAAATLMT